MDPGPGQTEGGAFLAVRLDSQDLGFDRWPQYISRQLFPYKTSWNKRNCGEIFRKKYCLEDQLPSFPSFLGRFKYYSFVFVDTDRGGQFIKVNHEESLDWDHSEFLKFHLYDILILVYLYFRRLL